MSFNDHAILDETIPLDPQRIGRWIDGLPLQQGPMLMPAEVWEKLVG